MEMAEFRRTGWLNLRHKKSHLRRGGYKRVKSGCFKKWIRRKRES